ncbi:MAG: KH domain-containing protein [Candidatus Dependentiae bacterium]|nr:KH domain-containing protein [Candidatus Dependentiae bacterium]
MIKQAFEHIVKTVVDKPESVVIEEQQEDSKVKITIKVDEQDIGKIIGKEGRTIKALRVLAASIADKGRSVSIDIVK